MPNFILYDYNQNSMIVINYKDQLQPGTFEHAIHYLVDNKLDLSIFDSLFKNDDTDRPAYDPAILIKIILFAYSKGITSSRTKAKVSHKSKGVRSMIYDKGMIYSNFN